jgi:hypothetical protein
LLLLALVLVGCTNLMLGVRPFVHLVSLAAITALVFPLTALALSYGTFTRSLIPRTPRRSPHLLGDCCL